MELVDCLYGAGKLNARVSLTRKERASQPVVREQEPAKRSRIWFQLSRHKAAELEGLEALESERSLGQTKQRQSQLFAD